MRRTRNASLGLVVLGVIACGRIGIDKRDEHGMTALMYAAQKGDRAETEALIRRGANVNAVVPRRDLRELIAFISWMQSLPKSDIGYTPLMYAADGGHADIVRLLLDKHADPSHVARGGMTAIRLAVWRGNLQIMQQLVDAGAKPGAEDLASAIVFRKPDVLQFLLDHGVSPNAMPPRNTNGGARQPRPPIILAASAGDSAMVAMLVRAGADLKAIDENGWTAARWAEQVRGNVRQAGSQSVSAILERSGGRDEAGERAAALFAAIGKKDVEGVRAALATGANPNAFDNSGIPPLVTAAQRGHLEMVDTLLKSGARVNTNPQNRTTALNGAIENGNIDVVKRLIAAGADVNLRDKIKRSPLEVASSWKRVAITEVLLAAGAKVDAGALPIAALNGDTAQVRMLLDQGADPNANNGRALSESIRGCYRHDNTAAIQLLLARGARAQTADDMKYTPLHRAAALCSVEVVRMLLQHAADPNAKDDNLYTPLMAAAFDGKLESIRVLIAAKADVNARDNTGKTVLQYAGRHPEIQAELRKAGAR